jgi:hypothetical protein
MDEPGPVLIPLYPNRDHTVTSPLPPRNTSDRESEVLRGGSGEVTARLRGCKREWDAKVPNPKSEARSSKRIPSAELRMT